MFHRRETEDKPGILVAEVATKTAVVSASQSRFQLDENKIPFSHSLSQNAEGQSMRRSCGGFS
jgi:hypothetical protein